MPLGSGDASAKHAALLKLRHGENLRKTSEIKLSRVCLKSKPYEAIRKPMLQKRLVRSQRRKRNRRFADCFFESQYEKQRSGLGSGPLPSSKGYLPFGDFLMVSTVAVDLRSWAS